MEGIDADGDGEPDDKVVLEVKLDLPSGLGNQLIEEATTYGMPIGVLLSGFITMVDIVRKERGVQQDFGQNINWMQVSDAAPWLIDGESETHGN